MAANGKEPTYVQRTGPNRPVQPGGGADLWAEREREMARRRDPGWLQFIFDQTREDKNRGYTGGQERIGGLNPERAEAVAEILIQQARQSDKTNDLGQQGYEASHGPDPVVHDEAVHEATTSGEATSGAVHDIGALAAGTERAPLQEVAA